MPDDNDLNNSMLETHTQQKRVHYGNVDYSKAQSVRFYANHVAGNMTLFDIRLILSDVDVVGDHVSAVQTLTLLLSPEVAEMTRIVLEEALTKYGQSFGKVRLPEELKHTPIQEGTPKTTSEERIRQG
ncbi:hypothetical protein SBA4_4480008 [Candidatus Sulfopaludibacter sp. SbA4]|nr:hypothetical protein SBA4_4480008 [Candidatus Sulfopaludibacter sp. SbA4]